MNDTRNMGFAAEYAFRNLVDSYPDRKLAKVNRMWPDLHAEDRGELKVSTAKVNRMGSRRLFNRKRRQSQAKGRYFEAESTEECFAQIQNDFDYQDAGLRLAA